MSVTRDIKKIRLAQEPARMGHLAEYFSTAYLINLPERKDRLKQAVTELSRIGWSIGSGGVQVYPARRFDDRGRFPNIGARGCFQSHLACLREAKERCAPYLLLLEDDIAFSSALFRLQESLHSQLQQNRWDFCYLGHEHTGNIARADFRTSSIRLMPYSGEIRTSHMILISGRIFPRLIVHLERVAEGAEGDQEFGPMPVDGAYNIFRRHNKDVHTLIAIPKLGWQRPSRSDITPRVFDDRRTTKSLLATARRIKYLLFRCWS